MKKTVSVLLLCALLIGVVFTLASCTPKVLAGDYSNDIITYKFKATGEVTVVGLTGGSYEGQYKIQTVKNDDGEKETQIVFSEFPGLGGVYNGTYTFGAGKDSEKGEYIKIDGAAYYKK